MLFARNLDYYAKECSDIAAGESVMEIRNYYKS